MSSLFERVLGLSPLIEVAVRKLYWNSNFLIKLKNKKKKKHDISVSRLKLSELTEQIRKLGIEKGDLLIMHSSMDGLVAVEALPQDIIDKILEMIGKEGTLVIPAFPYYSSEMRNIRKDFIKRDVSQVVLKYNPLRTPAWTGILPNIFMRYDGVVRSRFPINTLAAKGPLAEEMMKNNLEGDRPLPCGVNSSWKYCADRHAKILFLGVHAHHSITMIHVAEDIMDDKWPIKGWYRDRKFIIEDKDCVQELCVRERHPKFAQYIAELTLRKDLIKVGLLKVKDVNGVVIEMIDDSSKLIQFLLNKNSKGYPFYIRGKKNYGTK